MDWMDCYWQLPLYILAFCLNIGDPPSGLIVSPNFSMTYHMNAKYDLSP